MFHYAATGSGFIASGRRVMKTRIASMRSRTARATRISATQGTGPVGKTMLPLGKKPFAMKRSSAHELMKYMKIVGIPEISQAHRKR